MSINPPPPQWRQEQRLLFLEPGASRLVETMCLARPVRDLVQQIHKCRCQWGLAVAYRLPENVWAEFAVCLSEFEQVGSGTRSDMVLGCFSDMWLTQA